MPPATRPSTRTRLHIVVLALFAVALGNTSRASAQTFGDALSSPRTAQDSLAQDASPTSDAFGTTVRYLEHFYPLWFTNNQSLVATLSATVNSMVAPSKVSPLYGFVVASNYDTLYAGVYLDLTAQPTVITIPETHVGYSILVLDGYGNVIETGLPYTPGAYAFTGPGFSGTVPDGVTPVPMAVNLPVLFVKAVKFSPDGHDQTDQAAAFRSALNTTTLSHYLRNPSAGRTITIAERNLPYLSRRSPIS